MSARYRIERMVMATQEQIRALLESHIEGNDKRFASVSLQLAVQAARSGQSRFASELKQLVDTMRGNSGGGTRLAVNTATTQASLGNISGYVALSFPNARLADLVLSEPVKSAIERLLLEQRQRDNLKLHGLHPDSHILLIGPPGTGKTSTARVIAGELGLPLYTVRLETVISKYMGETAAKLKSIFDFAATSRGVFFFDEVDALAVKRTAENDVGEMRRVLSSFLQFLEEEASESIILAATNNPQLLDSAIFRRFDLIIEYGLPDAKGIEHLVKNRLIGASLSRIAWTKVSDRAKGLSPAEICIAAENAAKDVLLSGRKKVVTDDLLNFLDRRHSIMTHYIK